MKNSKIQPHDIKTEMAVLGAMLSDSRALHTVVPLIKTPDVFYKQAHKDIYAAIVSLEKEFKPIDMFTVADRLRSNKKLAEVGGEIYLIDLDSSVATGAHSEFHATILLQLYLKRELINLGVYAKDKGYDDSVDAFDLQNEIGSQLDALTERIQQGDKPSTFTELLGKVTERVEMLDKLEEGELIGIHTGFKGLDRLTGGYQDGHLIIVAARPGMGKTSYALKQALVAAQKGKRVGFFSVEMPAQELTARLATIASHFHLKQLLQTGFEKQEYWRKWHELTDRMNKLSIMIDDYSQLTISELRRRAITMKRQHGLDILFVDYIQLMKEEGNGRNREQEIARISGGLKGLAKELNIPVIALAQLSRKVEERTSKRPRLADLRESGAIEQDADMVQLLFRPVYYGRDMDDDKLLSKYPNANTEVIIAKYRHGSVGKVGIYFDANKVKFIDVNELVPQVTEVVTEGDSPF